MTPEEYCAARAAPSGSSLYYALLFHSPPERRALHACFALLEEVRRGVAESTDPTPVGRRVLWWLDELGDERLAASRHPVLVELRRLPVSAAEIRRSLEPAIQAMMNELSGWQPESDPDWQFHCRALNASAWQLGAQLCNPRLESAITEHIDVLATATGQLEKIRELSARVIAGRCPLPRALLQNHGLHMLQGNALLTDPRLQSAVSAALRDIHARLSEPAAAQQINADSLPLFCRVLRGINLALCEQLLRRPVRLLSDQVALWPLRKLWIAWRERR